jgi:hypothetical protein
VGFDFLAHREMKNRIEEDFDKNFNLWNNFNYTIDVWW